MALDHAIMTALIDERMSGYELTKSFDTSLGFFWKASHQQIYKALRDLEKRGLLSSEDVPQQGKPDKVVYGLKAEGRQALDEWVFGQSQHRDAKDDLLVKLYNLDEHNAGHLRVEFAERVERMQAALTLYRRIRARHYEKPEELSTRRRGIYLALMGGIRYAEMQLKWLADCEALLEEVARRPVAGAQQG